MRGRLSTKESNRWNQALEYQALRQFIKLTDPSDSESAAKKIAESVKNELTPRQQEFVRMYYIDQMTMYDIAAETGISVSTVSKTLKRARERLRKFLKYSGRMLLDEMDG